MAEGYIGVKFVTEMIGKEIPKDSINLEKLKHWCKIFHDKNLAPPYEGGSYGNLSFRVKDNFFIITASSSGLCDSTTNDRFVSVNSIDLEKGIVKATGSRKPSSEAMVHYIIYKERPDVKFVFHGHCAEITKLIKENPKKAKELGIVFTDREDPYGTLALVESVKKVLGKNNYIEMLGHGFLALGKTAEEAGNLSLDMFKKVSEISSH